MGEAIAIRLAEEGVQVVLNDLELQPIRKIAADVTKRYDVRTLALAGSVASREDIAHMVEAVIKSFRRIDILVNNAGILYPSHARFSGESSPFVEHGEVVVQWNVVRYAIARSQAVATAGVARLQGRSHAATNGFLI